MLICIERSLLSKVVVYFAGCWTSRWISIYHRLLWSSIDSHLKKYGHVLPTTKITIHFLNNKPFPSCFMPHDESGAWCTTFHMKMSFHSHANKSHFHIKGCASRLAFITRHKATWKWLILYNYFYREKCFLVKTTSSSGSVTEVTEFLK